MPPKRGIREVRAEFNLLLDDANKHGYDRKFNCFDKPAEYQDYVKTPKPEEAEELCVGCPIFAACKEFGEVTRPGGGIWGGVAYQYGIPLRPAKEVPETKVA